MPWVRILLVLAIVAAAAWRMLYPAPTKAPRPEGPFATLSKEAQKASDRGQYQRAIDLYTTALGALEKP